MIEFRPIHDLAANLENARLAAIEELAAIGGALPVEMVYQVASLQMALTAVREEISNHEIKIGGGAEVPLK